MKKIFVIVLCAALFCGACDTKATVSSESTTVSPTPFAVESSSGLLQVTQTSTDAANGSVPTSTTSAGTTAATAAAATTKNPNAPYDPSIFVIKAQKSWEEDVGEATIKNECELYLYKIDANDNRRSEGSYQGSFWLKTEMDFGELLEQLQQSGVMTGSFEAGGEAFTNTLAVSLNTTDDKKWTDYSMTAEDGETITPGRDMPVGKGSFAAQVTQGNFSAQVQGIQGEQASYSTEAAGGDVTINYIIQAAPDSAETAGGTRKVKIQLWGDNFSVLMDGEMTRSPGYTEDVVKFSQSTDHEQAMKDHLQD